MELIQHFELVSNSSQQPSTPSQTPRSTESCNEYADELLSLSEMGFKNTEKNLTLLKKHKGDISAVVEELLSSTI
jgi:hypothetical protein